MPRKQSQVQQMMPYIIAAGVLVVILVVVGFWPTNEPEPQSQISEPVTVFEEPVVTDELQDEPEQPLEQEVFQPLPEMQEVIIGEDEKDIVEDEVLPVIEVEEETEEPLDVSDSAITAALINAATSPAISRYLVTDGLLQKFVINVSDLANGDSSPRSDLVKPPEQQFRVYRQAGATYIEPASFQRYTPYVNVLSTIEVSKLVDLLEEYRDEIEVRFAEISRPGQDFDQTLLDAIDTLLDTPEVPVPIEVYSESVVYKFKDERLEELPLPQKQLLRTGPENMRRIKMVLRELKEELQG